MKDSSIISLEIHTQYVEDLSEPQQNKYEFTYTIHIRNNGNYSATLLNRYWLITDADGKQEEIEGKGVVGKQPTIPPGETFIYSSRIQLCTPVGTMQGHYDLVSENGYDFSVKIPPFRLAKPDMVH